MRKNLSPSVKYEAVQEAVRGKNSLIEIAKKYQVTRQSLYFWVKKYRADSNRGSACLKSKYVSGSRHPKSISWKIEKEILHLVIKDPDLAAGGLKGKLKSRGYEVSNHGIYNVLLRHELQTKELRHRYVQSRPTKVVLATKIAPAVRAAIVEEHIKDGKSVAVVCRNWGVSRPTFYAWERRYRKGLQGVKGVKGVEGVEGQGLVEALARKYKSGEEHHRAIGKTAKEQIIEVIKVNPNLSINKILTAVKKAAGPVVGHHGIQNFLQRTGLNTFAKRLAFVTGLMGVPKVQVAPLYRPVMPTYSFRMLLGPIKSLPRLLVTDPKVGLTRLSLLLSPALIFFLWTRMIVGSPGASPVGLFFASVALFFGFFFLVYSMKYYTSIILVLKLAQSGARK